MKNVKHVLNFIKLNQMNYYSQMRTFQKLGIDLILLSNENNFVITDYFSKRIEIEKINKKSVGELIKTF